MLSSAAGHPYACTLPDKIVSDAFTSSQAAATSFLPKGKSFCDSPAVQLSMGSSWADQASAVLAQGAARLGLNNTSRLACLR